ncbi:Ni-sirohydrochlorin a,c-diamide synthase [Methanobrevibacter sp. TMH8]|uniref:Ni-sirohydrochlorin a,c-diamide synthase n=1 Tax=Methanobrevibacter sp. TMH8 TaxID=2848611 RepID=UPI001CCA6897|nr:Ni-sirohydrochlorin a,c-diamide synthase [Methanobrevibacter sp. TMH8]MBZ9570375.1 Ni-sirohydrochlorin a,c-diamide synthase [Methanobrevibacter sp. TMH8]
MRIVLAGTGSAVGKTTISTGIMKALSNEMNVQSFKIGPDYIDPSYHSLATNNPPRNLDSFFMNEDQLKLSFDRGMKIAKADIGIIEGVRGLYEGISPTGDIGSTASVAKALDAPVILIMNAKSLVKSAAALVLGFKALDTEVKIEGVILNKIKGKRHYLKAKEAVETLSDVKVIGAIPRDDDLEVKERHLGLVPALEQERIANDIDKWSKVVKEYIDLDALKEIAKSSPKIKINKKTELWNTNNKKTTRIGIARDEVFNFYYTENFESLEDNNAKLTYFSPFKDEELPDVDALYIGGGYPEIFAKELEANESMKLAIKKFHNDNKPIYGECGGLIYLSKSIDGFKTCDILPYPSQMTDKVQGLSYVIAKSNEDNLISQKGEVFRGHEFHYTKLCIDEKDVNSANFAFDIERGRGIINKQDGLSVGNTLANYIHLHACSCPNLAYNFTKNINEL